MSLDPLEVVWVDRLELVLGTDRWAFADENRTEIDRHFETLRRDKPGLWNGRVLMLGPHTIDGDVMRGRWFETDYASMLAWEAWGAPDRTVRNGFGQGALRGSDGAYLLGEMGGHTANAGRIYFPSGTPEPGDVVGEHLDMAGSVLREVEEETGLTAADFTAQSGWHAIDDGRGKFGLIQVLQLDRPAEEVRRRILDHLSRGPVPELADIRIARGHADLHPQMFAFVQAFLTEALLKQA